MISTPLWGSECTGYLARCGADGSPEPGRKAGVPEGHFMLPPLLAPRGTSHPHREAPRSRPCYEQIVLWMVSHWTAVLCVGLN